MKSIAILTTGSEFLQGKKVETNSACICRELFARGYQVSAILTVPDGVESLESAIRECTDKYDIIIMTGGLGPTEDDNTVEAVNSLFNRPPVIDAGSYKKMEAVFNNAGMEVNASDEKMVMVPRDTLVLENVVGLAPGFAFSENGKTVIAMPGVPREMEAMLSGRVLPYLENTAGTGNREYFSCRIVGFKESEVNQKIISSRIPFHALDWGMTAEEGIKEVTFVQKGSFKLDWGLVKSETVRIFTNRVLLPNYLKPEEELVALMRDHSLTLATAESCTGGLVSKRITDVAGSSGIFSGGIIAYSNTVKTAELSVSEQTLERFGAVSEEAAFEMASGVRDCMKTSYGLSVTGIAGPGGGTDAKPVGTVCFAIASHNNSEAWSELIPGDRHRVRTFSSLVIIDALRRKIRDEYHENH